MQMQPAQYFTNEGAFHIPSSITFCVPPSHLGVMRLISQGREGASPLHLHPALEIEGRERRDKENLLKLSSFPCAVLALRAQNPDSPQV